MKKRVFVFRTRHDRMTRLAYGIAQKVIDVAKQKGFEVVDFRDSSATRCHVEANHDCIKRKRGLAFIYAHGTKEGDGVIGQCKINNIFDITNTAFFRGKGVFAFVCYIGNNLGKRLVNDGASYFVGFANTLFVPLPLEQEFGECINAGASALLDSPDNPQGAKKAIKSGLREIERRWLEADRLPVEVENEAVCRLGVAYALDVVRRSLVCHTLKRKRARPCKKKGSNNCGIEN